ncbi:phospholipase A2 [Amyelois transitella]|uniref:phospholipase A2 n=1 Tax=Amyelois transitella TaxID=680683 RepID=UPI00298F7481|nr:phospholipase A2 [Amyelois transitella]
MELTDEELKQLKFSLIYPNTKWCGSGNIADNFDDLGPAVETDKCCRAHDNCPDVIAAGETRHNLTNEAFYSRLSCDCDEEFRQCLHNAGTKTSNQIGTIYFNALGQQCYRQEYPIKGCKRRGGWLNRKCLEYEFDSTGEKSYQWFYVSNY